MMRRSRTASVKQSEAGAVSTEPPRGQRHGPGAAREDGAPAAPDPGGASGRITTPVRPTPPGSHWRGSVRTPSFWMLVILLAVGAWRVGVILRPAVVAYPVATTLAVVLFCGYAVPFVLFVSSLDYLEREPAPLLLTAAAWGGLVALAAAVPANVAMQQILAKLASPNAATTWGPALTGPTVEEPLKMLGVVVIVLIARQHVNSVVDGFVYGAFVGLGFQVVEDVMYAANAVGLAGHGDGVAPVVATFLLRGFLGGLWSHTLFSALAGAGVAFVALRRDRPLWTVRIGVGAVALFAAWSFHFVWNSPWLADGFGYGAVGVMLALLIKGIPALLLVWWLLRAAGRREAAYYARAISELRDPRLGTPRELAALGSGRSRAAARRYAYVRSGRQCARAVRRLQRTQALLAVELSRGGEAADRYRADLLVERDRLVEWGHPEAYAPARVGNPWLVWAGGAFAAAALAMGLAMVIRALGGACRQSLADRGALRRLAPARSDRRGVAPVAVHHRLGLAVLVGIHHRHVDLPVAVRVELEQVRLAVAIGVADPHVSLAVMVRVADDQVVPLVAAGRDGLVLAHRVPFRCATRVPGSSRAGRLSRAGVLLVCRLFSWVPVVFLVPAWFNS